MNSRNTMKAMQAAAAKEEEEEQDKKKKRDPRESRKTVHVRTK